MQTSKTTPSKTSIPSSPISSALIECWIKMLLKFKKGASSKSNMEVTKILNFSFKDVQALWESYNKGDKNSRRLFHDPNRERQAYLCGFHLPNIAKFSLFLERLEKERLSAFVKLTTANKPDDSKVTILDVGCGSGAFSQALVEKISPKFSKIDVILLDKSKQFLEVAEFGMQSLAQSAKISIHKKIIDINKPEFLKFISQRLKESKIQNEKIILLFGNVWNEIMVLSGEKTLDTFVLKLFENLHNLNTNIEILVSEPVHKGFAKKMMELRETLINKKVNCLYPCPTKTQTCPLLARTQFRDYCYSDFKWDAPVYFKKYSESLDLDRSYLSSSLYYFSLSTEFSKKDNDQNSLSVLVGKPLEKDSIKLLQCTNKGTHSSRTAKFSPQSQKLRGQTI